MASLDILLVEDNPNDLELALYALRKHHPDHTLQVVRDGAEALAALKALAGPGGRPRLVLLDLKLPKMDGLEVLRQIKTDPQLQAIPVVVLTSSREDRDLENCYRLGANSYIVKPVDFEQFTQAVRQVGLYWLALNQTP